MNNKLQGLTISLLVTLSCTSFAQANTLYGDFRYSFNNIDNGTESSFSGDNNASRIGIKGDIGTSEDITAFYHLQAGVNVDGAGDAFSQRFYFAGIKGDFGQLVYGRTSTPYKMAGLRVDPFYDTSAGPGLGGATFGLSGLTNGWTDNSLAYSSKKMGAFAWNAALYIDDSSADAHDSNLGVTYTEGNLTAGLQYLSIDDTGIVAKSSANSSAIRVHALYKKDQWTFGGSMETIEPDASADQEHYYFSATYQSSEKVKLAGSIGNVSGVSATADGDGINLGAFYQLLKNTNVYVLYSNLSFDDNAVGDRDVFSIGVSHKFSFN